VQELSAAGVEPVVGDPDLIATIAPALEHVTVACILLGSVVGEEEAVRELHGPRLQMLLTRMLDSTVRGVMYEAAGAVAPEVLRTGSAVVRSMCESSRIPYALLEADPSAHESWLEQATLATEALLEVD
jgi:hypothetical protein